MSTKIFITVLKIGLLIGLMDGIAASLNAYLASGVTPDRVFRFIASGVFGMEAFKGSTAMITWGLMFHFIIALAWTALFFLFALSFHFVKAHYLISGVLYGIFIWAVMEVVVLPLSNTPRLEHTLCGTLIMIGIHMIVIGVPMSYMINRYLNQGGS